MKHNSTNTPLVDEHLQAVEGMKEAETDEFFYTRLKARMERAIEPGFPLRPAWLVAILAVFLLVNTLVVSQEIKTSKTTNTESSGFQNFASSYNLTVSTPY